jgi:hypothetical protein
MMEISTMAIQNKKEFLTEHKRYMTSKNQYDLPIEKFSSSKKTLSLQNHPVRDSMSSPNTSEGIGHLTNNKKPPLSDDGEKSSIQPHQDLIELGNILTQIKKDKESSHKINMGLYFETIKNITEAQQHGKTYHVSIKMMADIMGLSERELRNSRINDFVSGCIGTFVKNISSTVTATIANQTGMLSYKDAIKPMLGNRFPTASSELALSAYSIIHLNRLLDQTVMQLINSTVAEVTTFAGKIVAPGELKGLSRSQEYLKAFIAVESSKMLLQKIQAIKTELENSSETLNAEATQEKKSLINSLATILANRTSDLKKLQNEHDFHAKMRTGGDIAIALNAVTIAIKSAVDIAFTSAGTPGSAIMANHATNVLVSSIMGGVSALASGYFKDRALASNLNLLIPIQDQFNDEGLIKKTLACAYTYPEEAKASLIKSLGEQRLARYSNQIQNHMMQLAHLRQIPEHATEQEIDLRLQDMQLQAEELFLLEMYQHRKLTAEAEDTSLRDVKKHMNEIMNTNNDDPKIFDKFDQLMNSNHTNHDEINQETSKSISSWNAIGSTHQQMRYFAKKIMLVQEQRQKISQHISLAAQSQDQLANTNIYFANKKMNIRLRKEELYHKIIQAQKSFDEISYDLNKFHLGKMNEIAAKSFIAELATSKTSRILEQFKTSMNQFNYPSMIGANLIMDAMAVAYGFTAQGIKESLDHVIVNGKKDLTTSGKNTMSGVYGAMGFSQIPIMLTTNKPISNQKVKNIQNNFLGHNTHHAHDSPFIPRDSFQDDPMLTRIYNIHTSGKPVMIAYGSAVKELPGLGHRYSAKNTLKKITSGTELKTRTKHLGNGIRTATQDSTATLFTGIKTAYQTIDRKIDQHATPQKIEHILQKNIETIKTLDNPSLEIRAGIYTQETMNKIVQETSTALSTSIYGIKHPYIILPKAYQHHEIEEMVKDMSRSFFNTTPIQERRIHALINISNADQPRFINLYATFTPSKNPDTLTPTISYYIVDPKVSLGKYNLSDTNQLRVSLAQSFTTYGKVVKEQIQPMSIKQYKSVPMDSVGGNDGASAAAFYNLWIDTPLTKLIEKSSSKQSIHSQNPLDFNNIQDRQITSF